MDDPQPIGPTPRFAFCGLRYGRGRGGPRARRGDVRAAVLALLAERPMHGYEMIKEIEGKRRFTLTETGTAEQQEKAGEEAPWDTVRAGAAPEAVHLRDSVHKLHHAIGQVFRAADEGQQKRVRELLDETRRKIYAILAEES